MDAQGVSREIELNPGDMLIYRAHQVPWGRQYPLRGIYSQFLTIDFEIK